MSFTRLFLQGSTVNHVNRESQRLVRTEVVLKRVNDLFSLLLFMYLIGVRKWPFLIDTPSSVVHYSSTVSRIFDCIIILADIYSLDYILDNIKWGFF